MILYFFAEILFAIGTTLTSLASDENWLAAASVTRPTGNLNCPSPRERESLAQSRK